MGVLRGIPVRMKELELFLSILCSLPQCLRDQQARSPLLVAKSTADQTTLVLCFSRHLRRSSLLIEREEHATEPETAHLFLNPSIEELKLSPLFLRGS